jgi:cytochrome c oxidase subunit 2
VRRPFVAAAVTGLALAGCDVPSFGAPHPATRQGQEVFDVWRGFVLAAAAVGLVVYFLIFFTVIRYRRRGDELPNQRDHNYAVEIIYTVTPVLIVAVLFFVSIGVEKKIDAKVEHPARTVNVTGFQWGWQFAYPDDHVTVLGTGEVDPPELVLPVDETTRLVLSTTDVNHSFWVPSFLDKRDLIGGVANEIDITPTAIGTYDGRCAEYCGLDHWRMDFVVRIVSRADFDQWINDHRSAP